jgi:tellurite resistance protein TerA
MKPISKGQKISLEKEINTLSFLVGVNWDQSHAPEYEIDTSLILLSERGKMEEETDFIFYNNPESDCGSVKISGDPGSGFKKIIKTDLGKMKQNTAKILFLLTIDHGAQLNYRFGNITNISFAILAPDSSQVLMSYPIEGLTKETAVIGLELYKHNNVWKLLASGNGFNAGLDAIIREYGSEKVQVADSKTHPLNPPLLGREEDFNKTSIVPSKESKEETSPLIHTEGDRIEDSPSRHTSPVTRHPTGSISLSKIVLEKKGQSTGINLVKNDQGFSEIKVKLTWTKGVDLDLYAFYKTRAGNFDKVYFANKGSLHSHPYIYLDRDAGVGNTAGQNEENLTITRMDDLDYILISVNIFRFFGFMSKGDNFARYDGRVNLQTNDGHSIEVPLISEETGKWCVIAKIDNTNPREPKVININQVSKSEPAASQF